MDSKSFSKPQSSTPSPWTAKTWEPSDSPTMVGKGEGAKKNLSHTIYFSPPASEPVTMLSKVGIPVVDAHSHYFNAETLKSLLKRGRTRSRTN